jgi:uncharacterized protein YndB with AHSA1/START domain
MIKRTITHGTFTLERRYPAAPSRVFKALADPASKKRWFTGPQEWGPDVHEMDFRVGGRETSVGGPKGGAVHRFDALYQDIVPEQRIIYTYDMYLDDTRISVSLASFEFHPDGDGTRLVLTEMGAYLDGFDDGSERERGTADLLDALGVYLAREIAN